MGRNPERPTLKTIAAMTGLAVPTVSRALSGAPDIGAATRETVRAVADQIGYVPNRAGVRLRTGRSYVIGLVLQAAFDGMDMTAQLTNAAAGALRGTPYSLSITPYFEDEDPVAPIRQIVETRAADALILNRIEVEDARVKYLMEAGFPFVTHGRSGWAGQHDFYDFDNYRFGQNAAETLARLGRRSLLVLAPPGTQTYAQDIEAGVQEAAARCGLRWTALTGARSDSDPAHIEAAVTQALRPPEGNAGRAGAGAPYDGIISPSAGACMAAVTAAEAAGLELGRTIDVVAKDTSVFLKWFRKGIYVQTEDAAAAGRHLAQAAIARIETPDAPFLQHLESPAAPPEPSAGR